MKLIFLADANSIHTVRWVNTLADRGHNVHLIFQRKQELSTNKISDNVILHCLKYSGNKGYFLNAAELNRLHKEINPDVVNAHYASGYGTLARLAKLRPLILSVWGSDVYDFPYKNKLNMKIIKKNLRYADKIASTSYCMASHVKKLLDLDSIDIEVTPFGVDVKKFSKHVKNKINNNIIIGTIKTLRPIYGIDYLINAARILINIFERKGLKNIADRIKIYIYGDGYQKEELINLTRQLNLERVIEFKGEIPNSDVPSALEEFDIFCVTSIFESFGVSAVEAMAMELPVVATDVDGFKEIIEDGKTGIIVERKNPIAVAEALEELVLDKDLRIKMGKMGRNRVLEFYNWDKNVDTMLELYEKCLKK